MGKRKRHAAIDSKVCYPCVKCAKECSTNCICCSICQQWIHADCVPMSSQNMKTTWAFYCTGCCFSDGTFDFQKSLNRYELFYYLIPVNNINNIYRSQFKKKPNLSMHYNCDTLCLSCGTLCLPCGILCLPCGTLCLPCGTLCLPCGTSCLPCGTFCLPCGTLYLPCGT